MAVIEYMSKDTDVLYSDGDQVEQNTISNAFFWKITKPLRAVLDFMKSRNREA